jgi:hypothetical protein
MSAAAYVYGIYGEETHQFVDLLRQRQRLPEGATDAERLVLEEGLDYHSQALAACVRGRFPPLTPEELGRAVDEAVIDADRYRRAAGFDVAPTPGDAFRFTLAAALAEVEPEIDAQLRQVVMAALTEPRPRMPAAPAPSPASQRRGATTPRLTFDDETRTVCLDGRADAEPLPPDVYAFLKAIGDARLRGKKLKRVLEKLPRRWQPLVTSRRGGGYCLTLPTRPGVAPE